MVCFAPLHTPYHKLTNWRAMVQLKQELAFPAKYVLLMVLGASEDFRLANGCF